MCKSTEVVSFESCFKEILFIVQSKDKLIASLKEGAAGNSDDAGVSFAELEELKHEKDMLKEELQHSRMTIETLRADLQVPVTY